MIWEPARVIKARIRSLMSRVRFLPTRASSTILPVMMLGRRPRTAESRIAAKTSTNWNQ